MPEITLLLLWTKSFFSLQSLNRVKRSMELASMRDTVDSTVLLVEGNTIEKAIIFTKERNTPSSIFLLFGGFTACRSLLVLVSEAYCLRMRHELSTWCFSTNNNNSL